jgi:hypothetical protein
MMLAASADHGKKQDTSDAANQQAKGLDRTTPIKEASSISA